MSKNDCFLFTESAGTTHSLIQLVQSGFILKDLSQKNHLMVDQAGYMLTGSQ